jgi:hypothetical protein
MPSGTKRDVESLPTIWIRRRAVLLRRREAGCGESERDDRKEQQCGADQRRVRHVRSLIVFSF